MSNEFDAAVAASMQPDQGQAARMGFVSAVDTNPDSYADAQRIARRNGVPVDTVLNLPQEMKRQDAVGSIDFNALAKTSPSTAALLADVEKAKIAHDDVENMSSIEEAISFIKGTGSAIVSAAPKFNEGAWGLARAGADLLPSFIGRPMAEKFAQYGKMQRDVADSMMPKGENIVSASWYSGMQSLGLNLLQLPLGIGGKMAPVLTSMGLSTGGQAYGEARDKGVNVPTALSFATSQGVVEAGTEMFGMPALFSMLKPGKFGTKAVEYLIKEQGGEQVATALQDLNEWAVLPENKNKTIGDYLKARPEAALQTALSTAFGGGGQVAVMKAASMIGQYAEKSARAEQSGAALDKLAELAKASKVLQRDPEAFAQFVEHAAEGGTEQVFIDADALMQSGVAEQIAAVSPAVASQLENALQIGGQIAIPVGEFAASIAPTEFYQSIAEHIKTDPEGFSRAEAQQYMQQHGDELKSEIERVLADKQGDSTFKASQEAVKQQVLEQLNALNRFTAQKNEIDATLIAARTAVRAAQLGMMPEEFYRGRALRFMAERIDGQTLEQGAKPDITLNPDTNFMSAKTDAGLVGGHVRGGALHITTAEVHELMRGKGEGVLLYSALVDKAIADGLKVYSDSTVEADAVRVYEALQRRGYDVRRLEGGTLEDGAAFGKGAKAPAFEIVAGPQQLNQSAYTSDTIEVDGVTRPTTNSRGQRIAQTEEGLRNFWRWFGDSRVVDKDGKPLVVYHGTKTPEFTEFMPGGDRNSKTTGSTYGLGVYLTTDTAEASSYGRDGAVIPVYVAGNMLDLGRLSARQLHDLTVWANTNMIESDKARFADVKRRVEFDDNREALAFFKERKADWQAFDGITDRGKPKATTEGGKYVVEFTDYNAPVKIKDANDAETMLAAVGWNSAADIGFDGVIVPKSDGRKWVVVYKPAGHVKSAVGNQGTFDPASPNILEQNNGGPLGAFSPASLTISLMKGANLSTFLHESAHYFFEDDIALASELVAVRREGATLSEGEQQIVDDVSALLSWHGLQGDIGEQVNQWYAMSFEERRQHHERTAESFEKYLMEGKAPSFELQRLFQTFRAWLKSVYTSVKNFLESHPEAGNLNDEIRRVFDRMLATTDEIKLAQQGRSMMPLFDSAEQAGMSMDEFARYHADDTSATNAGIDEMQARAMRDMAYSRNAHARMVRKLKAEAKEKRLEMRMDARRQVMIQPVYRAWQFLTGKLADSDKINAPEKRKSDPDTLDETRDSLFVAIAKLGGISRESVESEWGFDAKERSPMPVFGKHLLRREGGLTIDGMAEALGQYGYLSADENGKHDLHEFEDKFAAELRGDTQYSMFYDPAADQETRAGDQVANPHALTAARIDLAELRAMGLPDEVVNTLQARRMTASVGLHPDVVSELIANDDGSPAFSSGDELVRALAAAVPPGEAIESLTDRMMLEAYGELASPEAIEQAADKAIHNDVRARFVATEANALSKMLGKTKLLNSAAKAFAANMIDALKVRNIKPGQYASAEVRAAKAADKAFHAGDKATALAEKRNQAINIYAARAAYDALEEVDKGLRYLGKFDGNVKGLDAGYVAQIESLLERFDLRKGQSLKAIDKRTSLSEWIKAQRDAGLEPDIPAELENEAFRTSYKNLTVEEFRGLVDSVRQIEHLGRLKHKLLTAADQRAYEAVRDEIAASIMEHAQGREADTRTPTTNMGRAMQGLKRFWASHIKVATWARVMDGGKDGGPVWEYFIRNANERGEMETSMRGEATAKLSEILAPVFKLGKMGGKGQFFPSIGRSLNRESRIAIALNMGNDGNMQRLLGGEGWTLQQIAPVLQSLTAQEWQAVQAIWDHLESYRPLIGAKEMRVYGKEPDWVEARPFSVTTADGQTITLRGGYYPVKYDPAASQRAEEHSDAEGAKRQLQGAYTSATTRRSFTKSRVEAVIGRPLMYTLAGLYSGVNDVIHDLAWHEWLIDTNRLLRSQSIDSAMREHYGPEAKQQFKSWAADIAEGDKGSDAAVDMALSRLRQGVSMAGLGFNVVSAIMQPLGIAQSITRVGARWIGRGIAQYIAGPVNATRRTNELSDFMANRSRTRFRELNELRNQVQDQGAVKEITGHYAYWLMMRFQQMVDVPTWLGAYEKAMSEGNEESRAIALADQAVIDAQGGGETKDLSAIERGGPAQKLFTVFYSFMNTALNLGVSQTMSADTTAKKAKLAMDYAMLYVAPAVLGYFLKNAITPGDSGDDDDMVKLAKKLIANQLDYLMGLMVVVREFGEAGKTMAGVNDSPRDYAGPAGLRLVTDTGTMAKQVQQGELDDAFRKASINFAGDLFGLPSAQINRTVTGINAIKDGKTSNPAAIAFGFQEKR